MADEDAVQRLPTLVRIDTSSSRRNDTRQRGPRNGPSTREPTTDNHAYFKRHFAIPTPLCSPMLSRNASDAALTITGSRTSQGGDEKPAPSSPRPRRLVLTWRQRLKHFTWTFFCLNMATGQIANCLGAVPYRFPGLFTIGVVVMLFNILLFLLNTVCISLRFRFHPGTFWSSMTHPTESLFVPAFVISIGTILMNITLYGLATPRPWLATLMHVLFWTYCAFAFAAATGIYLIMWSTQTFTLSRMTPVWIFPAYPLLVVAPHAAVLAGRLPDAGEALAVIVGGFALQGIGFMVSTMVYAAFLYRLMTQKLPDESLRPGMFISVGPSGFTVAGVINLGREIGRATSSDFMGVGPIAGLITKVVANWMGVWLWGLAIFFFVVSVGAHWSCVSRKGGMRFQMTWWSFVFPNTGLTTGTFAVGLAFANRPIQILGCIFMVLLLLAWTFNFTLMIRAICLRHILWPEKQEDRDEGRWIYEKDTAAAASSSSSMRRDIETLATGARSYRGDDDDDDDDDDGDDQDRETTTRDGPDGRTAKAR